MTRSPLGIAVFASGGGTNFQALIDHQRAGSPWRIVVLVANREAGAVDRARAAGVPVAVIPTKDRPPEEVADETLEVLDRHDVDIIALAGYLRLLPARVVARYRGRIVNIHPALLPDFGGEGMYGMNVHRAVVAAGATVTGATVHLVDEEYDQGAILAQERVAVRPGDTPEDVAARVLAVEHRLYGRALDHLCASLLAGRPVEPAPARPDGGEPTGSTRNHEQIEGDTMKRALLSVSDKQGIVELGQALTERGWQLLSTGGTARALRDAGLDVTSVSEVTGHPEMMEGRVKTLHPAIHAGLLARRDRPDDMAALGAQGYGPIDLVAVNLYPFREKVRGPDVPVPDAMEVVDIGGPTMIRAAAKSHRDVWVVVDPSDYGAVVEAIDAAGSNGVGGGESATAVLRRKLAAKVFHHVSRYDTAIAEYLDGPGEMGAADNPLPDVLETRFERLQPLRYGENPGQAAAFYGTPDRVGLASLEQMHGKELSYNNILDLDGALLSLSPFAFSPRPAVCIVKHTTPCGLGLGATLAEAYDKALATDPTSAFGSVIATNREIDAETAAAIGRLFVECVVAPGFSADAIAALTQKKNIRLLSYPTEVVGLDALVADGTMPASAADGAGVAFLAAHGRLPVARSVRSVYGGLLAQTPPTPPWYGVEGGQALDVVTERAPTEQELDDLRFAWAAIFGVKSNAILLAREGAVLGIGAGQMSRVDSSKIAVRKAGDAGHDLEGAVLASDAFFPFRDGVDAAAEAGVRAVIQPGGSIRDDEVVGAADEHGIAMVFTGQRLFRH